MSFGHVIQSRSLLVVVREVQRDRPVEFAKRRRLPSPPTEERFVHFRQLPSELNQECAFPIQIAQG